MHLGIERPAQPQGGPSYRALQVSPLFRGCRHLVQVRHIPHRSPSPHVKARPAGLVRSSRPTGCRCRSYVAARPGSLGVDVTRRLLYMHEGAIGRAPPPGRPPPLAGGVGSPPLAAAQGPRMPGKADPGSRLPYQACSQGERLTGPQAGRHPTPPVCPSHERPGACFGSPNTPYIFNAPRAHVATRVSALNLATLVPSVPLTNE